MADTVSATSHNSDTHEKPKKPSFSEDTAKNKSNNYGKDLENADSAFSKKESFTENTSKAVGQSKRTIEINIQISKNLSPEVKESYFVMNDSL